MEEERKSERMNDSVTCITFKALNFVKIENHEKTLVS